MGQDLETNMEIANKSKKLKEFFKIHGIKIKKDESINCITLIGNDKTKLKIFAEIDDNLPHIVVMD